MWLLTLLTLASMFWVPSSDWGPTCIPFAILICAAFVWAAVKRRLAFVSRISGLSACFIFVCVTHLLFVFAGAVEFGDYIRGIVPFLFMAFVLLASASIGNEANVRRCYIGLVAVAALFAAEQLATIPAMITGAIWRSTQATTHFSVPFPLVGFHLSVAALAVPHKKLGLSTKVGLTLVVLTMLGAEVLTGTRSLLLGCVLPLIVLLPRMRNRSSVVLVCVLLLAAGGSIVTNQTVQNALRVTDTFAAIHGDLRDNNLSTRASENATALEQISDAPVLGHGLGARIVDALNTGSRVAYIHNSPLYLLVDFGVLGMIYWAPVLFALRVCWRLRNSRWKREVTGLAMAILGIIIFAQGFVAVRGMHATSLLFSLAGIVEGIAYRVKYHHYSIVRPVARQLRSSVGVVRPIVRPGTVPARAQYSA